MVICNIDIETFSSNAIDYGVYKYTEAEDFEIIIITYKINDVVKTWTKGEKIDNQFLKILTDPKYLKTAYNAQFEFVCLSKFFNIKLDLSQWQCTMCLAALTGLPFGLGKVAAILKTENQKDKKGKDLIKYFSVPCKPTKTNKQRTRNLPEHNPEKWQEYVEYNVLDVLSESDILKELSWFKIPDFEKGVWQMDQAINMAGVKVDIELVKNAIKINETNFNILSDKIKNKTGISNPNSGKQIKDYVLSTTGIEIDSLRKDQFEAVSKQFETDPDTLELLEAKQEMSLSAVKKFYAIENTYSSKDYRARGLFQYYGALRTGRWAGRNVQMQNLLRTNLSDLDLAISLVKGNEYEALNLCFDNLGNVLGNLVRPSFIPEEGSYFIISDFSAIEARVLAWVAGESWRLEVFKGHGKIYEASAAMMFKLPIEQIDKELRYKGKVSELALGYQGGLGALKKMGGEKMGLDNETMLSLVMRWRTANKKICNVWGRVQNAALSALEGDKNKIVFSETAIHFAKENGNLIITLPSGRPLVYRNARISQNSGKYGGDEIIYNGIDSNTKQWMNIKSYGGKFVENIIQAISRDILTDCMKRLHELGYKIVIHVHDEIVIEHRDPEELIKIKAIIEEPIKWTKGLPLKAESFISKYYTK